MLDFYARLSELYNLYYVYSGQDTLIANAIATTHVQWKKKKNIDLRTGLHSIPCITVVLQNLFLFVSSVFDFSSPSFFQCKKKKKQQKKNVRLSNYPLLSFLDIVQPGLIQLLAASTNISSVHIKLRFCSLKRVFNFFIITCFGTQARMLGLECVVVVVAQWLKNLSWLAC